MNKINKVTSQPLAESLTEALNTGALNPGSGSTGSGSTDDVSTFTETSLLRSE